MYSETQLKVNAGMIGECISPTIREQMEQQKRNYERKLAEINDVLKLLDENPSFEKVHDAISKVQRL
jgi:hypothetical protein